MALNNIAKYLAEGKRLEKKFEEDRKAQPWEKKHNPQYGKFLADVAAVSTADLAIPNDTLFCLWFMSTGFQNLWKDKSVKEDRSKQELALFVRYFNWASDDDQGLMLIAAWWKRHHLKFTEAKLQYIITKTIPAAKEFAAKNILKRQQKQDGERRERIQQTTKFRILQVLFVAPSGPTEIATEIGEPVASVKMQLSRMKGKEVKLIKRGVYGLGAASPQLLEHLKRTVKLPKLSEFDALVHRLWKQGHPWVTPGEFIELLRNPDVYPGLISHMRKEYPFEFLAFDAESEDDHV